MGHTGTQRNTEVYEEEIKENRIIFVDVLKLSNLYFMGYLS